MATPRPWRLGDTDEDGVKIEKDEPVDSPWLIARAEVFCNSREMADGIETAANAALIVRSETKGRTATPVSGKVRCAFTRKDGNGNEL